MDKYVKQRKIGEGAFGKAILVRHKQVGKQFVVKEINIMKMSPKEREEARKEVSVLAQLKHPNIVKYRESFEEHGSLYICMDFCEKGDLYSKINSQRGLLFGEDQIMDWFVQICLAIKHIHDRKILHRDIKSQNIFLSGDGSVQLGDFGIAKVLNSTVELARTCIGTPYYLSPEICENRPYNNKSDIWSLGCVLYELTTLKHAFEAGNMKNLVLKIIRGSYPPVPPKYSYDLRGLIALLFKRAPKDRPSINSVLRKPFVSKKVGKFLSEQQIQDEFSHTVMHGKKVHRALPPPPVQSRPPSAGVRRPPAAKPAPAAPPKYNPAAVYGAPVARKSKDNRSSVEKKRPGSAGGARPPSAGGVRPSASSQDLKKKRQEFIDKEKRRREDAEKAAAQRKHRELQEKQKMARINKSKEEGWRNILGSLGSGDGDKQSNGSDQTDEPSRRPLPPRPDERNVPLKDRGNYEQYHAYLDKIQRDQADRVKRNNPADYMAAPKPSGNSPAPQEWRRAEVGRAPAATPVGIQYPPARGSYVQQAEANRKLAEQAAERARLVEDYLSRKRQAAVNKHRGQAQLFGNAASYDQPPRNVPQHQGAEQPRPASARDREEQEYLEKLRQIRQQNFMDRKGLLAKQQGLPDPRQEAEARKKKIEALRQQADDRAKQLKEQLEKQRKDIFNKRTPQNQENRIPPRGEDAKPNVAVKPAIKPAPAVPITGALRAIGVEAKCVQEPVPAEPAVGVTGALQVIGAVEPKPVEEPAPRTKSPLQQKKEGILKKLNERGRGKWGAPIKPAVEDKEEEQDSPPESSRSKWGQGGDDQFKQMPLEQTASQMEATSARDKVIQNPPAGSAESDSAKRQWGRPGSTVIKALEGLPVLEGTVSSTTSDDSVTSPEVTSKVGATITISKPPIQKGTIVIKTADEAAIQKQDSSESKDDEKSVPGDGEKSETIPGEKVDPQIANQNSLQKESHDQKTDQSENSNEKKTSSIPANTTSPNKPALANRPPLPAKPDVTNKPVVLPKPVLLPKPDKPMQFGNDDKVPTSMKLEGKGELFEKKESKVEPSKPAEGDNEEEQEDIVAAVNREIKHGCKTGSGVILGLTTGHFDMGNASMLRTCSEPDLAKLFKTADAVPLKNLMSGRSLEDIKKLEEEEEEKVRNLLSNVCLDEGDDEEDITGEEVSLKLGVKDKDGEEGEEEEENVDEDDEDYEDLLSVRETMQSLLLQDSTDDDSNRESKKISISSLDDEDDDHGDDDDNNDDDDDGDDEDDDDGDEEPDDDKDDKISDGVQDSQEDKPECDKENDDEDGEGEEDPEGEDGQDNRSISMSDLFQSDESDADTQFGDEDDDYDLFSRLEESRAGLESELGCDKFLKVYKTVQALQEDEDEKIDEGARLVTKLLGPEKEHLYPKIFQLVMADAAFTEELNENKEDSLNSNNT